MSFIEKFFKKESKDLTQNDIDNFISKKIEENVNLDYTEIESYWRFDELSKEVSAFANTEGGLIFLGVSEERIGEKKELKIYPKEITWGDKTLTPERLEDNLIGKIKPNIEFLEIIPIREGNGSQRVIFLIDIPQSYNPPHMASDNRYYRRLNFRRNPMEHYEVTNLFKISWTMKEKLIEEIFIPLSSILEKQLEEFEKHKRPHNNLNEILSKTYYRLQLPLSLHEKLNDYNEQVEDLDKLDYYARRELRTILNKNIVDHLKIEPITVPLHDLTFQFKLGNNKTGFDLSIWKLYELIMKNAELIAYLEETYYQRDCNKISIEFSNKIHCMDIDEFNKYVWNKSLKESSENQSVINMIKRTKELEEFAVELLDEIINY